jgi:hypothetical protein
MGEKSTEAVAENIKLFIEVQDFLPSYDLVIWLIPHPLPRSHQQSRPATHRKTEEERQLAEGKGRVGREWGRRQIIRCRERQVLYNSFNTV